MNDPYDNEDDGYDDDQYDYDHPSLNPFHYYFKFDIGPDTPLSQWLSDIIKNTNWEDIGFAYKPINLPGWPAVSLPVNSWNPNTESKPKLQYLGSNYNKEPIWKTKYFISNPLNQEYKKHLQSNAAHFIKQPNYYKGLFDILN
jgi:hypothetical protein